MKEPVPSVLVTRPAGPDDPLALRLLAAGVRVHAVPTVVTVDVPPGDELDRAAAALDAYDWVVVTSVAGVTALAGAVARVGRPGAGAPRTPRFAAVGPATARALRAAGFEVALEASDGSGSGLARDLLRAAPLGTGLFGRRLLLPRASAASPELPALLRGAGAEVRDVVAYRTVEGPEASRPALVAALDDPGLAAIVVASGSAVRGLLRLAGTVRESGAQVGGPPAAMRELSAIPFVSIGPSTSAEVRRSGLRLAAEAVAPTVDALAEATLEVVLQGALSGGVPHPGAPGVDGLPGGAAPGPSHGVGRNHAVGPSHVAGRNVAAGRDGAPERDHAADQRSARERGPARDSSDSGPVLVPITEVQA